MSTSGPEGLSPESLPSNTPDSGLEPPVTEEAPDLLSQVADPDLPVAERIAAATAIGAVEAAAAAEAGKQTPADDDPTQEVANILRTGYHDLNAIRTLADKITAEADEELARGHEIGVKSGFFRVPTKEDLAAYAAGQPIVPVELKQAPAEDQLPELPKRVPREGQSPADAVELSPLPEPLLPDLTAAETTSIMAPVTGEAPIAETPTESPLNVVHDGIAQVNDGEPLRARRPFEVLPETLLARYTDEVLPFTGLSGAVRLRLQQLGRSRQATPGRHNFRETSAQQVELPPPPTDKPLPKRRPSASAPTPAPAPAPGEHPRPGRVRLELTDWQQLPRKYQPPIQPPLTPRPQVRQQRPPQPEQPQYPQQPIRPQAELVVRRQPGTEIVPYREDVLASGLPQPARLEARTSWGARVRRLFRRARGKRS